MNKLLLMLCLAMLVFSCTSVPKTNSIETVNETEGKLLNSIFETTRNDFDFINKKVGFIKDGKRRYFDMQKKHSADTSYPLDNGKLYIFNAQQKAKSGGYDAAIVYWSKFLFTAEQVVEKLKYQN